MELVLPKLGLTMTEATVALWMVHPGDAFEAGATLVVIETDKITMDVEAPGAGVLEEVLVAEGDTVPVGTPIARWRPAGDAGAARGEAPASTAPSANIGPTSGATPATPTPRSAEAGTPPRAERVIATPLARRIAAERGISLHSVTGTGPGGRIKAADVEQAARIAVSDEAPGRESAPARPVEARLEAPTPQQRTMARRMAAAVREIPHMHLVAEVPAEPMLNMCEALNEAAPQPRVTLTHLLLAAVGQTLVELPEANRVWDDNQFRTLEVLDVGLAVDTPHGLMAPVVRDAGRLGLRSLSRRVAELVERARSSELTPDDLAGGAVTISNLGMYEISMVIPIINPGQSSILGVGRVRPVFRCDPHGQPVAGKELTLVLSCDHRVHDGASGSRLLNGIRQRLANPSMLAFT